MFTRVTIIGSARRAAVLLPSDEPLGTLVPEVADLLQEPPAGDGLTLTGRLGQPLDLAQTPEDQGLLDGAMLRLSPVSSAAAPPEVSDVTEVVAEAQDAAPHRWDLRHLSIGASLGLVLASWLLLSSLPDAAARPTALVLFLAGTAASAPLAWFVSKQAGLAALAVALGAIPLCAAVILHPDNPASSLASAVLAIGLAWIALGVGCSAVLRSTAPALGAAVAWVLLGTVFVGLGSSLGTDRTMAIVAVLVVIGLGVVPLLALNASRLATLDDLVVQGQPTDRSTVLARLAEASSGFSWVVFALAMAGGAAAAALFSHPGLWSSLVAGLLCVIMATRTRALSSAAQAWPLWVAIALALVAGTQSVGWSRTSVATGAAVALLALLAALVLRPRAHSRIRLRRLGDVVETLSVLALVPCVLGLFGLYDLALGVFS